MSWGATILLILFAIFIVLAAVNPNISCFGKRLRSPFYPLRRKKAAPRKTTDYDFHLTDGNGKRTDPRPPDEPEIPGERRGPS